MPTAWADLPGGAGLSFFIAYERILEVPMKKVAIIMGSDSDLPVVEKAVNTLAEYGVP